MSARILGRKKIIKNTPESKTQTKQLQKKEKKKQPVEQLVGIHNLKPPYGAHKRKKLLGRGPSSGHGKTSTKGHKGLLARAGRDFYIGFEGGHTPLIRRIPKRGFISKFKKEFQIVNLKDLNRVKQNTINLELLEQAGLIKDKNKLVKILADGEIKSAVKIQAHAFSKAAFEAIKSAGGTPEVLNPVPLDTGTGAQKQKSKGKLYKALKSTG